MIRAGRSALVLGIVCACSHVPPTPQFRGDPVDAPEVTAPGPLLAADGALAVWGWSRHMLREFNPGDAGLDRGQLRRWEFYTVTDRHHVINVTLADVGFAGFCSVDTIDLARGEARTAGSGTLRPAGRIELPPHDHGVSTCRDRGGRELMRLDRSTPGVAQIRFDLPDGIGRDAARGEFTLAAPVSADTFVGMLPYAEAPGLFFYENKQPTLRGHGTMTIGDTAIAMVTGSTFAVMDWGRGLWPDRLMWRWGAAFGDAPAADGVTRPVALNLGSGFADPRRAGENVFFYDGTAHRLGEVNWTFDPADRMAPWTLASADGRLRLAMQPLHNQSVRASLLVKAIRVDKVYGTFRGQVVLDDGRVVEVPDMFGFAEEVFLRW